MTFDKALLIFSVVCMVAILCLVLEGRSLRQDLARARASISSLELERETLRHQLAASQAAYAEQEKGREEAQRIHAERSRLLEHLPSGWGDTELPADVVRMLKIGPQDTVGPDRATGSADGGDANAANSAAD